LSGKVDRLVGLKENVILGHLIPAGTGFRKFQEGEVRYQPEALQAIAAEDDMALVSQFPLLQGGEQPAAKPAEPTVETVDPAPSLDTLLGNTDETGSEQDDRKPSSGSFSKSSNGD